MTRYSLKLRAIDADTQSMKKLPAIAVAFLSIVVTAPVAQADGLVAPIGAQACDATGYCMTWEAGDYFKGTTHRLVAGTPYTLVQWDVSKSHVYRKKHPYVKAGYSRYFSFAADGVNLIPSDAPIPNQITFHDETLNTPDCDPNGENRLWINYNEDRGVSVKWDAPHEFAAACGYTMDPMPGTTPPDPTVADPKPVVAEPAKPQSCVAIVVAKKRVAVTSTGQECSSARNILARFMRSGAEPRGWVCTRLAAGRSRSATCGTPSKAAKRIVGRWRV